MRVAKTAQHDSARAAIYDKWAFDLLDIGDGAGPNLRACSRQVLLDKCILFRRNDDVALIADTAIGLFGQGLAEPLQTQFFTSEVLTCKDETMR
eukprot:363868-Chlamydomonas_euryale.AAC.3